MQGTVHKKGSAAMKPVFVCYAKCTTCQKAKKWLDENHIDYTERSIKENRPSAEELRAWQKQSGLPLRKFWFFTES